MVPDTPSRIHAFLSNAFAGHEFHDDEDIFALGFVSSLFAMQLVEFVEHEFTIVIESEDLEWENFRSITSIARLVERKLTPATAA